MICSLVTRKIPWHVTASCFHGLAGDAVAQRLTANHRGLESSVQSLAIRAAFGRLSEERLNYTDIDQINMAGTWIFS